MSKWSSKQQGFLEVYYVATIVRVLWLGAKRERFSCNDRALLARCARHIKSVFNLIVNIHVMVSWQLSNAKRVSADQCHMTVSRVQVYSSLRWIQLRCFFSVMTERTSGGQGRDSGEKKFFWRPSSPLSKGLDDRGPPLSQGLDPALRTRLKIPKQFQLRSWIRKKLLVISLFLSLALSWCVTIIRQIRHLFILRIQIETNTEHYVSKWMSKDFNQQSINNILF